jgi:peptidylprolyl isomerase
VREIHTLAGALAAALLCACGENAPDQSNLSPDRRVATRYAAELRVDLLAMESRPTGLYTQDVVIGDGIRADSGDVATVHYTGWLPSGVEFDTSRDGNPLEVALGYGRVIAGWDQGVVGMRVGGRRRLVVPPALGYGSEGRGRIPGNSTLVFDVELLEVEDRTPQTEGGGSSGGP